MIALGLLGGGAILLVSQTDRTPAARPQTVGPAKQVVRFEPQPRRPTLGDRSLEAPSWSESEAGDADLGASALPAQLAPAEIAPSSEAKASAPPAPDPLVVYRRPVDSEIRTAPTSALVPDNGPVLARTSLEAQDSRQGGIGTAKAAQLGDRNYQLLAGAVLPCLLQTALDSSRPGHATCLLPSDIYSDNGATVLLEKGTRVLGRYDAGLARGDQRLLVRWLRAVSPAGVTIWLDAPAADALGRSGLAGELDTRFWSRFGGAVLLSMIDQVQAPRQSSEGQVWVAPSQTPTVALEASIDLPPRLVAPQGLEVSIFVTQDLDFSEVYDLRRR
ncbi:MAG: type IV secretion system protein VirB10 [Phenylobacterium sp.]|nr:type IV secretion system protein VirB10 [Phenylobacterium sp.]